MAYRKSILSCVERYKEARLVFAQAMACFANKPESGRIFQEFDVFDLMLPLLHDSIPGIKIAALHTFNKLICSKSPEIRYESIKKRLPSVILKELPDQHKYFKVSALETINCALRTDKRYAKLLLQDECLEILIDCLEEFEIETKEKAIIAIGTLAKLGKSFALNIAECSDTVRSLVHILEKPNLKLKQAAANTLSNIATHSQDLAQYIVDCGAIPHLLKALDNDSPKLKAATLKCLNEIAKHSESLANLTRPAIKPTIEIVIHPNENVRKNAVSLLRDICKQSADLAAEIAQAEGIETLLRLIECDDLVCTRLPAIMTIGYLAAWSKDLAEHIVQAEGIVVLQNVLVCPTKDQLIAATTWALCRICVQPICNENLCKSNLLTILSEQATSPNTSDDMKEKCMETLNIVIPKCKDPVLLENLLMNDEFDSLLEPILCAVIKLLKRDPASRKNFVSNHCLKRVQEIDIVGKPELAQFVKAINSFFPPEVVQLVSPAYLEDLMEKLDEFKPPPLSGFLGCQISDPSVNGSYQLENAVSNEVSATVSEKSKEQPERVDRLASAVVDKKANTNL